MREILKNTFVPHSGNNNIPHIFKEMGVFVLVSLLLGIFVLSQAPALYFGAERAAVLPAVLVDLANEDRGLSGLNALRMNTKLQMSAQAKANHMATNGYFAHYSPDGISPWYWIKQTGYSYQTAGENLAVGFFESEDVERAWMASQTHRENILNSNYTEIGIATARGTYQGMDAVFVVQHFGRPAFAEASSFAKAMADKSEGKPAAAVAVDENPVLASTVSQPIPASVATEPVAPEDEREEVAGNESAPGIAGEAAAGRARIVAQVVQQTDTMIVTDAVPATSFVAKASDYASLADELRTEPRVLVTMLYLLIGFLIALVSMVMLFKELKTHHYKHMAYAFCLLLFVVTLLVANQHTTLASIRIL
ncbi:MAG: hypothetical protein COU11_01670 [Candidatus Harrisonbacteria bacterium CG10_big_fil_rev_8_21_14_0_10_49_15]|uniref:SCP domain-containing protein n=1 Tax=Candidatus Harrisonbacteria bacterium CG10_big_fil_rev_8_21_14_0_10_49_15 TaxID=1974587 RepID=A0A2H0ULF9_9BACT|nr:MAG: hypothetical protein COU11_01670 [Candidatus Harrisonbacteria bacterium CG10_big_fil_rev_8_21_14_0_10_49_15]